MDSERAFDFMEYFDTSDMINGCIQNRGRSVHDGTEGLEDVDVAITARGPLVLYDLE